MRIGPAQFWIVGLRQQLLAAPQVEKQVCVQPGLLAKCPGDLV